MKSFFTAFFDYVEVKISSLFSDEGRFGSLYPEITPIERFFVVTRAFAKKNAPFLITLLLSILVLLRVQIIYNNLRLRYSLVRNISDLYHQNASQKLLLSSILVLVFTALLVYIIWENKRTATFYAYSAVSVIALSSLLPFTHEYIEKNIVTQAIFRAEQLKHDKQYQAAIEIFQKIIQYSDNPQVNYEISVELARISSEISDYKTSIETLAQIISLHPQRISFSHQQTLHEAIYTLGELVGITEAEVFLQKVEKEYPARDLDPLWLGAKPTSPLWLGISPNNYINIIGGDVRSLGTTSLKEESVLRQLVQEFPDDPLADWGRLILGEHLKIVQNEPESRVRDWAIYKAGLDAYLDQDFWSSINYFYRFLDEFPRHRWADDAGYRIARSYELIGDYERALDKLLLAQDYPDGNMYYIIRPYAVAIIDTFFDSNDIKSYMSKIASSGKERHVPLLKFCLGEQLIKEGKYAEAQSEFSELMSMYPGTIEAQYSNQNLYLLSKLIELDSLPYPDNLIQISRFLINDSTGMFSETLIIYNEMYLDSRLAALANIGMYGPSWEYIASVNDYLKALSILEKFIGDDPNHSRVPEALYLSQIAYYNLTFDVSFLPSKVGSRSPFSEKMPIDTRTDETNLIAEKLQNLALKLLIEHPDSVYTPEALTLTSIGLANMDKHKNQYVDEITQFMTLVLQHYPDHHLANNCAIYLARYYRQLGSDQSSNILKRSYYLKSREYYEITLEKYPSGHVGREALEELTSLDERLASLRE